MKTTKKLLLILLTICFAFGGLSFTPIEAQVAGSGLKKLSNGVTITTTLTGAKKHKVKFTEKLSSDDLYIDKLNLYIDGKEYTYKDAVRGGIGTSVCLLKVNKKTTLIYVSVSGDNGVPVANKVYRYIGGKLKLCGDIDKMTIAAFDKKIKTGSYLSGWTRKQDDPVGVGNNKFTIKWDTSDASTGIYTVMVPYQYSTSKMKVSKASNTYNIISLGWGSFKKNWGTVANAFKVYTTADGKTVSFTAHTGDRLKLLKVTLMKGTRYFQVKDMKGKTGWYKEKNNYDADPYFLEACFAG